MTNRDCVTLREGVVNGCSVRRRRITANGWIERCGGTGAGSLATLRGTGCRARSE